MANLILGEHPDRLDVRLVHGDGATLVATLTDTAGDPAAWPDAPSLAFGTLVGNTYTAIATHEAVVAGEHATWALSVAQVEAIHAGSETRNGSLSTLARITVPDSTDPDGKVTHAGSVKWSNGWQAGDQTQVVTFTLPGGATGPQGASAYEVAVANGFVGTEAEWLASLVGADGQDGTGGGASTPEQMAVDSSGFEVLTGDDLGEVLSGLDTSLLNARSTGLLWGGVLTGQGTDTLTISAAAGGIANDSDVTRTYTPVMTSQQTFGVAGVPEGGRRWFVTTDGTTITATDTEPTATDYHTKIVYGSGVVRAGVWSGITQLAPSLGNYGPEMVDLWEAVGIRKFGLTLAPAATDLTVSIGAGYYLSRAANRDTSRTEPNKVTKAARTPVTFQYRNRNNVTNPNVTALEPDIWDNGGTNQAIGGNASRAAIHSFYEFPDSGNVRVLRPQAFYTTLANAQAALSAYSPVTPASFADAKLLGHVILTRTATNLADPAQAAFYSTGDGTSGGIVQVDLSGYALADHNHDDRYYTKAEIDAMIAAL